jgi:hypothetical protein
MAQHRQNPWGLQAPRRRAPGGHELVTGQATPEEAEAFRQSLLAAAQAAADAGKEGGFLGFGAERVSAGERGMLDQVRAVLGMA